MTVANQKTRGIGCEEMGSAVPLEHRLILGTRIDATSYGDATGKITRWAHEGRSACVCVSATHLVMEAFDSAPLRRGVNDADLITPDGKPLVWALKGLGVEGASQVRGTDLTMRVAEQATRENLPIGLYGGTPELLEVFERVLKERFPGIEIACRIAPPFRPLTPEEDEAVTREIAASGARILFVGIGCPRQEEWMFAHKGRVPAVMVGVGAAFDFLTGRVRQAPRWMQAAGLEWAFRLMMNPQRLWKRYATHNPRFATLLLLQLLNSRLSGASSRNS